MLPHAMASQQQHKRAVKVRKIASLKLSSAVKVRKMGLVLGAYKNLDLYLYDDIGYVEFL